MEVKNRIYRRYRNCRSCGKICIGKICRECYLKKGIPLAKHYQMKRKREEKNNEV